MSIYAPSRRFDDGGIPNLIDLFGDNHPIKNQRTQDGFKVFDETDSYPGLYSSHFINRISGVPPQEFYYFRTIYDSNTSEYKYDTFIFTRKQALNGTYKEIINKLNR